MKYSIKEALLVETQSGLMKDHPLWIAISAQTTRAKPIQTMGKLFIDHPADGCSSHITLSLDDSYKTGGIYIDKLEVVNTQTKRLDIDCFRKGYAKEALALLVKAAEASGTHLSLIATPEASGREREFYELPGKDGLAALYSQYGFVEEYSNAFQVGMSRQPRTA